MDEPILNGLYPAHLETIQARYDDALADNGYDAALIGAGVATLNFRDDQHAPFRTNPQLMQWLPLSEHPGACLLYRPGRAPVAVVVRAESYWEEPSEAPGSPWADAIEIKLVAEPGAVADLLGPLPGKTALLGPPGCWDELAVDGDRNPVPLVQHLDYQRAWKTPYEVTCMRAATRAAVRGHRAAEAAFREGASEFEILLAFQRASGQVAAGLPYPPIIGIGSHGAVLHYQHYRDAQHAGGSLLIDAGCEIRGYASDITRTHALPGEDAFISLRDDLDERQQALCARVEPGLAFAELHHAAHEEVAGVLCRQSLVTCTPQAALERGLTRAFFPHGLGHLLGLQVHDVGGRQADTAGNSIEAPPAYPRLRLLRTLDTGFTLTIEPGIYFIDSLLTELRASPQGADVNWSRVDALRPFGGIRIEDNLVVEAGGSENLTRDAFAA